jgi:hypothetical protein
MARQSVELRPPHCKMSSIIRSLPDTSFEARMIWLNLDTFSSLASDSGDENTDGITIQIH